MKNDRVIILVVISLCVLLASVGTSIANIALPVLERSFYATFESVQWVTIAYLLASTVSVTIAGKLADRYGHRRVLLAGILLFTIASFLSALASTMSVLILLRAGQGMGAAVLMTSGITLIKKNNAILKTGSAMGLIGTMSAIGTALGPSVGGLLLTIWGWPAIFLFLSLLGTLVFFLVITYIHKDNLTSKSRQPIDGLSVAALTLSITAYALSMTLGKKGVDWLNILLILVSLFSGGLFVYHQTRSNNPLLPVKTFKNRVVSRSLVANFVVSSIMMTTLVVGPFLLTIGLGLDEFNAGLVMSVGPVISILTGIPAGKLVDTQGPDRILKIGLLSLLMGTLALALLPAAWGLVGYLLGISLLTPGYQFFLAGNNTAVMSQASSHQEGMIAGILNLSRNLGLITGSSVMGALFSVSVAVQPIREAKHAELFFGVRITFGVGVLLLVLVGITSWINSSSADVSHQ
ncbi:MFS transporter [Spirosoma linguale]|uniref:Major facilitator superfamily MFS_1 n=1 Tax=Spirosoma linguale (strain ATCC 33905 / DSM 74 / LMG 10896 / Claus 1) TaxID=504472 RepID=D2QC45_SPILD|nr:major facilitator superfamily MFS_1 [Spirosoma linguale DSM 74]